MTLESILVLNIKPKQKKTPDKNGKEELMRKLQEMENLKVTQEENFSKISNEFSNIKMKFKKILTIEKINKRKLKF